MRLSEIIILGVLLLIELVLLVLRSYPMKSTFLTEVSASILVE